MQAQRIETVLGAMSGYVPKAPTKLVNSMVNAVNKLEAEKLRRTGSAEKAQPVAQQRKQMVKKPRNKAL